MKGADILLGLQWGDEGKGKIVDVLTRDYDVVARFQGGPMRVTRLNSKGLSTCSTRFRAEFFTPKR